MTRLADLYEQPDPERPADRPGHRAEVARRTALARQLPRAVESEWDGGRLGTQAVIRAVERLVALEI